MARHAGRDGFLQGVGGFAQGLGTVVAIGDCTD
jgi:hypothetical protein